VTGWIETPLIDMSEYEEALFVRFDISRWPDDATIVQVFLNGSPLGSTITPSDEFQTVELPLTDGISSGKIKFESMAKRFFLDNVQIISHNATSVRILDQQHTQVRVYPNPACEIIYIDNLIGYNRLEISDMNGRVIEAVVLSGRDNVEVSLIGFPPGIYIIRFISDREVFSSRFIKYQQAIK